MVDIVIQYVLILLLVVGLGYLVYLLKDKDINLREDYFGLAYVIFGGLSASESTPENEKRIIRIISSIVQHVESNYKNSENTFKEEKAINMAKDAISLLNLESNIDRESLKYIIRLAAALLPATNKTTK
ncbi:hypothetical protein LGL55_02930 [Clostridium tagluense]|uniref:hypothetical protein n=1 Tax=Clostridium tagluense TaxID=360422 RepID=UPI001C0CE623|nr:hypothetical protein [Clostridium tagluense]MBU3126715.1 hypothetical protein [Clostridium tagluense]MCB2310074.1 hypothetical protein [Clostridium tagluense]MCB2314396.1 hypothetical protein [Clostridium tagluense]MCB2319242.1 hypothetical protein [Clostridium tagluense]MCB2324668.1 hypothetical protein [Clostridium tagluense]